MKVIVSYQEGHGWSNKLATGVGVSAGRTVYKTKEEAVQAAKEQHPGEEIIVED